EANASIEECVRLLERARSTPSARNHPGILRTLADAYSALPVPRFEDAERTYFELLRVKRVREDGRWVLAGAVKSVDHVLRSDREAMAQIQENLARTEHGIDREDRLRRVAEAYERSALWDPPPGSYDRQRLAGAAWAQAGEPAKAIVRLRAAATVAPPAARESAERAVAEMEEASRTKSDEAIARAKAALERPGGHREALNQFDEALRIDPERVAAHLGIARVRRYMGDMRGAFGALDQATRLLDARGAPADDPLRREVVELRSRFENLREAPSDDGR
ncbi:MAG TPA: hypothetical protein VND21_04550, partial [Planctomycetota bacterium]|nr:hypothetical protein [Planctomycetota bacterium]